MVEIEISTIPDSDVDLKTLTSLLDEFRAKTGVKVLIREMTWGSAWAELMTFASHGKGPDVSHIGGSWVSSLAMMNALRPFSSAEIEAMGGPKSFLSATWESAHTYGDSRIWAAPWTGYLYLICYRKDLLVQAGIDAARAFDNINTLTATLQKLRSCGVEIPWLNPYIPAPFTDLVHVAASWVWSAGGDFINENGTRVVFDSPSAMTGLKNWLETYRMVPEAYKSLGSVETVQMFMQGKAAAVLADIRVANTLLSHETDPLIRENLGIASITHVPWVGGGSFVVWQHVLGYPERERAAIQLVKFLTTKAVGLRWTRDVNSMPARIDVLEATYPSENPLHDAVSQAIQHGKTYHTVPLWRRVEYQLAQELGACVQNAQQNPDKDIESILREHIEPLARRLNLTLGN